MASHSSDTQRFEESKRALREMPAAIHEDIAYLRIPTPTGGSTNQGFWRIQLLDGMGRAIGVDVYGDVVLGRGDVTSGGDGVDLTVFGAIESGVSRRHAVIRPSGSRLLLVDQGSTNGTLHNDTPLQAGVARQLVDGDLIVLGFLPLLLRIVSAPVTAGK